MLQKMKRVQVIGPKDEFSRVVDFLYHEGTIDFENAVECISCNELSLKKIEAEKASEVSEVLEKISEIFSTLPRVEDKKERESLMVKELMDENLDQTLLRSKGIISDLERTIKELATRKHDLTSALMSLNKYEKVIQTIQPMEDELLFRGELETIILLIQKQYDDVLNLIGSEMEKITRDHFVMRSIVADEETLAAVLAFNKQYFDEVHSFIFSVNVNELRLPQEYMGKPFKDMLALIHQNQHDASEELALLDTRFMDLSVEWYQELCSLKKILEDIDAELKVYYKAGESEHCFVIMGWIPKKYFIKMQNHLKSEFRDCVVMIELETTAKDLEHAPIFYDNPWFVRPFEFFMQLVSPPNYREVDPSPVLAIFFPFFFGIMVGDIGYGLVILVFALLMKKKFASLEWLTQLMNILIISSFPTIFFGFIFGEFFGNFGEMIGLLHPAHFLGVTWNRVDAMIPLLILAIAIGVLHVFLGLVIGILNAATRKDTKHISEKGGMLVVLTGLIILVAMLADVLPSIALYPGLAMLIIGIPLIIYGGGAFWSP